MKQLLLIRHGRTVANDEHRYSGWTDVPLSEAGIADLRQKKQSFRYPSLERFAVYTSTLMRTEQTLRTLYGDVPHQAEADFREIHFGDFENRQYDELKHDPAYQAWITGDNNANVCPNGESGVQMAKRVMRRLEEIFQTEDRVCLISHGGVISGIMLTLFPEERKHLFQWKPENGEGYLLRLGEERSYVSVPFEKAFWQDKGFSFTQNRNCEYFPCHEGVPEEEFNCLFCYCPMYALGDRCGGRFIYIDDGVKSCINCPIPHRRQSYGYIARRFQEVANLAKKREK